MGPFTIYRNNEPGLLFADGPKWQNETHIRVQREYFLYIKMNSLDLIASPVMHFAIK